MSSTLSEHEKLIQVDAGDAVAMQLTAEMTCPLPGSRKIYVERSRPDIRVPVRSISLQDIETRVSGDQNPDLKVYDTSGPYTDTHSSIDLTTGIEPIRERWIHEREDVEVLSDYTSQHARIQEISPAFQMRRKRKPLRAKPGCCVTQMHYARQGIVTPEMEFVAIRENQRLDGSPHSRLLEPAVISNRCTINNTFASHVIPESRSP